MLTPSTALLLIQLPDPITPTGNQFRALRRQAIAEITGEPITPGQATPERYAAALFAEFRPSGTFPERLGMVGAGLRNRAAQHWKEPNTPRPLNQEPAPLVLQADPIPYQQPTLF